MASKSEIFASRRLRAILSALPVGGTIDDSPEFRERIERPRIFAPDILAEIHAEWTGESLDGIYPHVARKTGEAEAEIIGTCCLLSDQTLTPIHIHLQLSLAVDELSWLELRLGAMGPTGMMRVPYSSSSSLYRRLHAIGQSVGTIEWVYKVTFGERKL